MIPPIKMKIFVFLTIVHWTYSIPPPRSCMSYGSLSKEAYFADKSNLIHKFLSHERRYEYINAPSGFGKSTSLEMLNCFLNLQLDHQHKPIQSNETLAYKTFQNLNIWKHEKLVEDYLAKVPLINVNLGLSFESAEEITGELVISKLNANLRKAFQEYYWIPLEGFNETDVKVMRAGFLGAMNKEQMEVCISTLSRVLRTHFNRTPILLVDDYDSLYHYLVQSGDQVQEGYNIINNMIEFAIDQFLPDSVQYMFMVGISSVPIFSAGNLSIHVFHEEFMWTSQRFVEYFGFTNLEMESIFKKYQCSEEEQENVTNNYGNYVIKNDSLYITSSVAQYFKNRDPSDTRLKLYWKPTSAINLLFFFYKVPSFMKCVSNLLAREAPIKLQIDTSSVTFRALRFLASNIANTTINTDDHILHPMLLEQGYVTRTIYRDGYRLPNSEAYHSLYENFMKFHGKRVNETQFYSIWSAKSFDMKSRKTV